jgi:hypothetical protein
MEALSTGEGLRLAPAGRAMAPETGARTVGARAHGRGAAFC